MFVKENPDRKKKIYIYIYIPKERKSQKNASVFDDKYTEYESEARKELSIEQYLDEF